MGEASLPGSKSFEELTEKTRGPRERILEALRFYGGQSDTQSIRHYGDIPSSTYHFDKLEDDNLIERTGTADVAKGGSALVFEITGLGEKVADELDAEPSIDDELRDMVEYYRKVAQRTDEMQQRMEQLEQQMDDLDKQMQRLEGDVTTWIGG
jgi:polyhydroxyalkanoate synthesis regulator phasin